MQFSVFLMFLTVGICDLLKVAASVFLLPLLSTLVKPWSTKRGGGGGGGGGIAQNKNIYIRTTFPKQPRKAAPREKLTPQKSNTPHYLPTPESRPPERPTPQKTLPPTAAQAPEEPLLTTYSPRRATTPQPRILSTATPPPPLKAAS